MTTAWKKNLPRYNSEKMLPRNILPWKILWFFAKTIFLTYVAWIYFWKSICQQKQANNLQNLWKFCLCIPHQQNERHFLPSTFWDKEKTLHALPLLFPLFLRRNFAPADGLPFQCNLTYFYYIFGRRKFSTFLFSVAHLPQKWPPCRCQKLTEVSHKKNWRTPKEIYTIFVVFYSFDSWTLEKDMPQWLTDVKSTGKLFLRR